MKTTLGVPVAAACSSCDPIPAAAAERKSRRFIHSFIYLLTSGLLQIHFKVFARGAKHLCQALQQFPADHAIGLHEGLEVPIGDAIADEVGGGGDGRHAGALVDERDFTEIV